MLRNLIKKHKRAAHCMPGQHNAPISSFNGSHISVQGGSQLGQSWRYQFTCVVLTLLFPKTREDTRIARTFQPGIRQTQQAFSVSELHTGKEKPLIGLGRAGGFLCLGMNNEQVIAANGLGLQYGGCCDQLSLRKALFLSSDNQWGKSYLKVTYD